MTDEPQYKPYELTPTEGRRIKFQGELLAEASTSPDRARSDYSGATGRWTILRLYRTKGGKYVCQRIDRTQWQGERDTSQVEVVALESDVQRFFGDDGLAYELYDEAGIDVAEEID